MRHARFLVTLALLCAPAVAQAEGMRVDPGEWEFTTTVPGAAGEMAGKVPGTTSSIPGKTVYTECVRDQGLMPQRFVSDVQGCRIIDPYQDERSMSWKMSCSSPAGPMNGRGSFHSTGSTVSGSIEMTMNVGGQKYTMKTSWTGRRIGECR